MQNKNIFLIVELYLDGETKEILGYKTNEEEAIEIVNNLNKFKPEFENFNYGYMTVEKLK